MTPERALYLYAATSGDCAVADLYGIGDEPVDILVADGLGLAVSDVTTAELAAVNDDSADPRLVAVLAQRHDSVIRTVTAAATAVLPFRLGIVVTDREAAHRFLTVRADALRSGLARVAGCDEWGVTVRDDGDPAAQSGGEPVPAGTGGAAPGAGAAYLARRRQHFDRLEQRRRAARELVAEMEDALAGIAGDSAPGRREGSLLLDRAYLVRRDEQPRFVEILDACGDRLAADGFALRVTGPWPPYSFVTDLEVTADG
ncbi:GvpL/GvpF family gas vesicle protein [Planosporangium sp. 12N6]|uniref:GvpL/GvpF family gas vesicle protein n=1 Tax=Planosporangium spinosum TaxID=3402278 RepID=UPI003CF92866